MHHTLVDFLITQKDRSDRYVAFVEANDLTIRLTYQDLYREAIRCLGELQNAGLKKNDELIFQINSNRELVVTFWACLLGGIIPVPLTVGKNSEHKTKLIQVTKQLNNPYVAALENTGESIRETLLAGLPLFDLENRLLYVDGFANNYAEGRPEKISGDDIAFIQFSSGTTGTPKGIVLTHRNLLSNLEGISTSAKYTAEDLMFSWMPLTHDMGMIGFHLNPIYSGCNHFIMSTNLFVRSPNLWMDMVSEMKATILCSPNFGYRYLLKFLRDEKQSWDLSSVRVIYNGAEPIAERLCEEFNQTLKPYGLSDKAMCPVYGLAEASVAVSMSDLEANVRSLKVDRNQLDLGQEVRIIPNSQESVSIVNVGRAIKHTQVRIVDDFGVDQRDLMVGHLQIKGANVTSGYYNNAEATAQLIDDEGWLYTGDIGFLYQGDLHITGRAKDIIFVNGQNYYPYDIEREAEAVEGVELNKVVVTGFFDQERQSEQVLAFIFHRGHLKKFIPVFDRFKAHINATFGFEIQTVIPVKDIPRTTSGKLQRFQLLERYRKGAFQRIEQELHQVLAETRNSEQSHVPTTETEAKVLAIWKQVLGLDRIGISQKFFEIGGNSLKAAEVAMKISKAFEIDLPTAVLLERPTIRELAAEIASFSGKTYQRIPQAAEAAHYPLSLAQSRLYYAWQADPKSIAYNTPTVLSILGELDFQKLESCLKVLLKRHGTLRASFVMTDEPRMKLQDEVDFSLVRIHAGKEDTHGLLQQQIEPFDLEQAPLFRSVAVQLQDRRHLLLLDFHHIISDGISIHHFVRELLTLYNGQQLPAFSVQYQDYTVWEKQQVQSKDFSNEEAYWTDQLSGDLPKLDLPTDYFRPSVFHTEGRKIQFNFDRKTREGLHALAKAQQCTLHALIFSIYNVLLSKYSGQHDLIVGIPVAGRNHPDVLDMQGMFVNNLAIRTQVNLEDTFITYLTQHMTHLTEALRHQAYPFDFLINQVAEKRDVSRNQVFDTMFIYQNMGFPREKNDKIDVEWDFFDPGFSKYDLSLEILEYEEELNYGFEYASRLFKPETVERIAAHFAGLVEKILHDPHTKLSELSLVTDREFELHVKSLNETHSPFPEDKTIHQLFEAQAEQNGEAIALDYKSKKISYEELNRRADHLAFKLHADGVKPGDLVAVLLDRSPDFITSILAVLKAGGAYLPIATDLPSARIRHILKDSKSAFILTSEQFRPVAEQGIDITLLTVNGANTQDELTNWSSYGGKSDDLAYVIYTSGTTGGPKGVMIEHGSLVNYACWAAKTYIDQEACFPLYTSVSFDLTVTSIFVPLISGNKIVIYEATNDLALNTVLEDNKANIIKLTPSHLKLLKSADRELLAQSNLEAFIVGGEALDSKLAGEIEAAFGRKVRIYNEYGPTEATVGCMIHQYHQEDDSPSVPIGVPIDNTQVYVLDENRKPVPVGVHGDLYVSGKGLAKGYLHNEEMTRKKFVDNPFISGQSMYKTGDVVRILSSGKLEFVKRKDEQVKISGYRVELPEIEQQLNAIGGIKNALVILKQMSQSDPLLYAYYQLEASEEETPNETQLRDQLVGLLPHYMIPVRFIPINEIPLTTNGKVDFGSLPDPVQLDDHDQRPINEIESLSLAVWAKVLGANDLSVNDNFFELGGDSIKAVQISSRLSEQDIHVEVRDILTYPSVRLLVPHCRRKAAENTYEQGAISGEVAPTPITSWFLAQAFENPNYFNQSVLLDLKARVDLELLGKAFTEVLRHHDTLRLNYDSMKKCLVYREAHLTQPMTIEVVQAEDEQSLPATCESIRGSLELSNSLLIKAALIDLGHGKQKLFITAHHFLVDGIAWRILLEDLVRVYQQLSKNGPVQLPAKTASFKAWSEWVNDPDHIQWALDERHWWQQVEAPLFTLPRDFDGSGWSGGGTGKVRTVLDQELTSFLLKRAHQAYNTNIPMLLNAALVSALEEYAGLTSYVIEQEHHGRSLEDVDLKRTVGWFTAMYPLRIEYREDLSDLIKAVKEASKAVPNDGIGYGILKYLGADHLEGTHQSEVRLNFLGEFGDELNNDLFSFSHLNTGSETAVQNALTTKLDLICMVIDGELRTEVLYSEQAFKTTTIQQIVEAFIHHLTLILEHIKAQEGVHFTPSDFDMVDLNEEELNALFD